MSRIPSNTNTPSMGVANGTSSLTRGTLLVGSKSLITYSLAIPETGSKTDITWWNRASEMDLTNSVPLQAEAVMVCWNPENSMLAILDVQHSISLYHQDNDGYVLWDLWDKQRLQENVQAIRFAPRSGRLWIGGSAGVLRCLDCNTREFVDRVEQEHNGPIAAIAINSDDSFLASLDADNVLYLHNLMKNTATKLIHDASERLVHLEFSTKRSHLVAAGDDGHIYFWNTQELPRTVHVERNAHHAPITGLQFSPFNHMMLCSVGLDRKIFVFDVDRKRAVRTWTASAPLTALACTAESPIFIVGTNQGVIFAYKLDLKEPIKTTQIEGERVRTVLYQTGAPVKTPRAKRNPGIARIAGNTARFSMPGVNSPNSPLFSSPSVDFSSPSLLHEPHHRTGPTLPGAEDLDSSIEESKFQTKPTYRLADESISPDTRRFTLDSTIGYSPIRGKQQLESLISPNTNTPSTRSIGSRHATRPKSMIVTGSSVNPEIPSQDREEVRQRSLSVTGGPITPTNTSRHTDVLYSTPIGLTNSPRTLGSVASSNLKSPYSPTKLYSGETPSGAIRHHTTHSRITSNGTPKPNGRGLLAQASTPGADSLGISSRINDHMLHRDAGDMAGHFSETQVQVVQQVVQECLRDYVSEVQASIREEIRAMQLEMVRQMFIQQEEMREDWLESQASQTQKMEEELEQLREENHRLKNSY
ncbi:WD40 repeat-like protein [Basidiobolus meristosporus CBS 931.73]|uniref:WD40 repeat-like protein n=1 Tax=Basidiobolus meristosporus CBS 931.73 TaxID=1314790 RepID=A0A1Y1YW27_9FUNG|nr:WD40 repeat-like protein [Basidiobolus meristosporus CBS 931.73]|eukprot:ORY02252.1 WD40 repeat-like protein [Basidiobolus meristosporus CBS 931.73]